MKKSIEEQLVGVGNAIEAARRKGQSLSAPERRLIDRVQTKAIHEFGYSWSGMNALIMEGERGLRGSMPFPLTAKFIGGQDMDLLGLKLRLYNIEGDHPLNNSTVGVTTLWKENIHVPDLSFFGVRREVLKEQFILAYWHVASAWQVLLGKMGVRS